MRKSEKEARQLKKKESAVVFEAVRDVIHGWDPYGLLELGCPPDEFDAEIQAVVRQVNRIGSVPDAVHVVSRVFSSYFEPQRFRLEDCQAVGEQLHRVLAERGILADSK